MNTKDKRYKEYNRLQIKLDENYIAQKNLGYKELDEPILHGYNIEYVLRDDILNRDDAWLYKALIKNFGETNWCKDKSFIGYNWKTKMKQPIKPYFRLVSQKEYDGFIPSFQKLWVRSPQDDVKGYYWNCERYRCIVPEYFFKTKITKNYITTYKVIDEVLLQEESFLKDKLYGGEYKCFSGMNGGMKPYGTFRNRVDRAYNKQTLKYNMGLSVPIKYVDYDGEPTESNDWCTWENGDVQGKEFKYSHKHSAKWDRW